MFLRVSTRKKDGKEHRYFSVVEQMIDVYVPTTDGRELCLTRYTQPEPELKLLLDKTQAHIACTSAAENHRRPGRRRNLPVVQTF